jgi:oligoribonuclease (3'-5' exoribonuclease)
VAEPTPVKRVQVEGNLAWLDLEMTGLDAQRDVILQAALIVTDAQLNVLEEFCVDVWQPEHELAKMTPFVRDMHEKSGLLARLRASKVDTWAAEQRLLERVTGHCPYPAVLCGNTIGQDKRFVERWMPGFAGYLSYRTIDVSSVKLLAKAWYGPGALFDKPKDREHEALFDVRNSIAELQHYRKTIFR